MDCEKLLQGDYMYKRWLSFALTATFMLTVVVDANATTISEVNSQKKQTESNLYSVNSQIDQIEARQEQLKVEVEMMDTELVEVLASISICKDEIVAKEDEVLRSKEALEEAKEQEQVQYDAMKQRIRFMYEKGDNAYLQVFFEAKSLADMINKADYVEKLYTYDRELLETYTEKKEATREKKELLEEEEAELLSANYELEQEQASLEQMIAEKRATISNFDDQLANARIQAQQYKKELTKQTQELRKLEEEETKRQEEIAPKEEPAAEAVQDSKTQESANPTAQNSQDTQTEDAEIKETDTGSSETNNAEDAVGNNGADEGESTYDASQTDATDVKPDSTSSDQPVKDASETKKSDAGNASLGQQVANYASKFVGNPYKFGGTSLTEGTDCSGFTMSVYAHFGITIPRDSTSQRSAGRAVTYAEAQPGDIICYAGHVAIYIGNGQIVHASTEATGIKYGNATYRTILAVRRIV